MKWYSIQHNRFGLLVQHVTVFIKPVSHKIPVYPGMHVQVYELIPSTHKALFWHGELAHSSMSAIVHYDMVNDNSMSAIVNYDKVNNNNSTVSAIIYYVMVNNDIVIYEYMSNDIVNVKLTISR